jgi:hypothetical protein
VRRAWICAALIAGVVSVAACDRTDADVALVFQGREFIPDSATACGSGAPCATVWLSWLEASGGSPGVARKMNDQVLTLMRLSDGKPGPSKSPKAIAAAFQSAYVKSQASNRRSGRPWELKGVVAVPWRSPHQLITLRAVTYEYAGGAHGLGQEWYGVIDGRSGRRLSLRDIFADSVAAAAIVERQFRREKRVAYDASLAKSGWWFAEDLFEMTANVGLTAEGVVFHWNPYAIGPYAAGPTTLVVPYDSLQPTLARGIAP